jgi:hypothetical protein
MRAVVMWIHGAVHEEFSRFIGHLEHFLIVLHASRDRLFHQYMFSRSKGLDDPFFVKPVEDLSAKC